MSELLPHAHLVLLVAGRGTRLAQLTDNLPKCMVQVAGRSIIERANTASLNSKLVSGATIVSGYRSEQIDKLVAETAPKKWAHTIRNHQYDVSGTALSTLHGVEASPPGNLLIVEGDVVFESKAIGNLAAAADINTSTTLVAKFIDGLSGSAVRTNHKDMVTEWLRNIDNNLWLQEATLLKTVNLHWIASAHRHTLISALRKAIASSLDASLENVMHELVTSHAMPIRAVDVGEIAWWEVDDQQDLARANEIFG